MSPLSRISQRRIAQFFAQKSQRGQCALNTRFVRGSLVSSLGALVNQVAIVDKRFKMSQRVASEKLLHSRLFNQHAEPRSSVRRRRAGRNPRVLLPFNSLPLPWQDPGPPGRDDTVIRWCSEADDRLCIPRSSVSGGPHKGGGGRRAFGGGAAGLARWWRLAAVCGWRSSAFDDPGEHGVGRGPPNNSMQPTR